MTSKNEWEASKCIALTPNYIQIQSIFGHLNCHEKIVLTKTISEISSITNWLVPLGSCLSWCFIKILFSKDHWNYQVLLEQSTKIQFLLIIVWLLSGFASDKSRSSKVLRSHVSSQRLKSAVYSSLLIDEFAALTTNHGVKHKVNLWLSLLSWEDCSLQDNLGKKILQVVSCWSCEPNFMGANPILLFICRYYYFVQIGWSSLDHVWLDHYWKDHVFLIQMPKTLLLFGFYLVKSLRKSQVFRTRLEAKTQVISLQLCINQCDIDKFHPLCKAKIEERPTNMVQKFI